ncbi:MAG: AlbA family DNA-binding domain-containing protein [Actinomycetota bacterium]
MTPERFAELRALAREQRAFEVKRSGSMTDSAFLARVIRAALAMANRQDGGVIVLGVEDGNPLQWTGMTEEDLATWSNPDSFADKLAVYSDPPIAFELGVQKDTDANGFVVIEVEEFVDVPVICKKDYPEVLQAGHCYVRSRRKPESVPVPGQAEMRELLDLASEKALSRVLGTVERAGGRIVGAPTPDALFDEQAGDFA